MLSRHAGSGVSSFLVMVVGVALVLAAGASAQTYTFTRFAGPVGGPGSVDASGTSARIHGPWGVVAAPDGSVYVVARESGTIRRISASGVLSTVAGLAGRSNTTDGARHAAGFLDPRHAALDSAGNLFIADASAAVIRKVSPVGAVTTFAGAPYVTGSANGTGAAARFNRPVGIAVDADDNLYVTDEADHTIRKITPARVVSTVAGSPGVEGYANASGSTARFRRPSALAVSPGGLIYIADTGNHVLRVMTSGGSVSFLAGTAGVPGSSNGTGAAASFSSPGGVTVNAAGVIFVADTANHTIRVVTSGGAVTTLAGVANDAGTRDGLNTAARFWQPTGISVHSSGLIYVADRGAHVIREVTSGGSVTTIAGREPAFGDTNATGLNARFYNPSGVATDAAGNVYVADRVNYTVRKITPAGVVSTYAGSPGAPGQIDANSTSARFADPISVTVDASGNVYVADSGAHTIRKIETDGDVTTLAGIAYSAGDEDGPSATARFSSPSDLTTDASGNVYVTDLGNHTIRMIEPDGDVSTLAGLAGTPGTTNATGSSARFNTPRAIARVGSNLFVADQLNHVIRKITLPGGVVTTFAGGMGIIGLVNANGLNARFYVPDGIAADASGNLYVTEHQWGTIRKITSGGDVTTLAGDGFGSEDGTATFARFNRMAGIDVDPSGNLFVADIDNNMIRKGAIAHPATATIDAATGPLFVPRQLNTSTTATSYYWALVRRPVGSSATLSSSSARNPTFTPDVPDRYTFKLDAESGSSRSITLVDFTVTCSIDIAPAALPRPVVGVAYSQSLTASGGTGPYTFALTYGTLPQGLSLSQAGVISGTASAVESQFVTIVAMDANGCQNTRSYTIEVAAIRAPTGVVALASGTSVNVSWNPVSGAAGYNVYRRDPGSANFNYVGSPVSGTAFTNPSVPSGAAYLFVVRARNASSQESPDSNADLATTITFTDPSVSPATTIKAIHVEQLRTAVYEVLRLAFLLPPPYVDPGALSGVAVKAAHIAQLRTALNDGRTALGLPTATFSDVALSGIGVKAAHIQELRNATQ